MPSTPTRSQGRSHGAFPAAGDGHAGHRRADLFHAGVFGAADEDHVLVSKTLAGHLHDLRDGLVGLLGGMDALGLIRNAGAFHGDVGVQRFDELAVGVQPLGLIEGDHANKSNVEHDFSWLVRQRGRLFSKTRFESGAELRKVNGCGYFSQFCATGKGAALAKGLVGGS